MFYFINRFWEKISSSQKLKYWLGNKYSVRGDTDGTISVLCGNLQCTFGVKTYRYVGYTE